MLVALMKFFISKRGERQTPLSLFATALPLLVSVGNPHVRCRLDVYLEGIERYKEV